MVQLTRPVSAVQLNLVTVPRTPASARVIQALVHAKTVNTPSRVFQEPKRQSATVVERTALVLVQKENVLAADVPRRALRPRSAFN